jgi:hypothetical protein
MHFVFDRRRWSFRLVVLFFQVNAKIEKIWFNRVKREMRFECISISIYHPNQVTTSKYTKMFGLTLKKLE